MSTRMLWGEGKLAGALQPWLTVDGAPWLTVDDTPWSTTMFEQTLEPWLTVDGEPWFTVQLQQWLAITSGAAPPKYWMTADVSSDGGVPFGIVYKSNPYQPAKQGGENVFKWLYLALSWSMGGTIRVRALVDGARDDVALDDGSVIRFLDSTFQLPQQSGSLQRKSGIFAIPLVRALVDADGVEQARFQLRGERFQFLIDTPDPLGVGELMVDGAQLDSDSVRKAIYGTVQTA